MYLTSLLAVLILSYPTISDTVEALEDLIRDKIGHKYKEKIDMVSYICLVAIFYIIYPLMRIIELECFSLTPLYHLCPHIPYLYIERRTGCLSGRDCQIHTRFGFGIGTAVRCGFERDISNKLVIV